LFVSGQINIGYSNEALSYEMNENQLYINQFPDTFSFFMIKLTK